MARKKGYAVGKGKPPLHSRFQPGESGNKKGRPKGSRNIATDLAEELNETVAIQEGGKTRKLSKRRVMIKATVNKAMKGDVRAVNAITALVDRLFGQPVDGDSPDRLSADDAAVLEAFIDQVRADHEGAGSGAKDKTSPALDDDPDSPQDRTPATPRKRKGT